jgi:pyrimidine-specific ribonucleoside hydrolase
MTSLRSSLALPLISVLLAAGTFGPPAHGHEAKTPVIVDTDMALDDVRALALLASDDHVSLEAAIATGGASSVGAGAGNLAWVLDRLGQGSVPVASGRSSGGDPPAWREVSETLGFTLTEPRSAPADVLEDPAEAVSAALGGSEGDPVYLCLGPATTLAALLDTDPSLAEQIGSVYFLGDPPSPRSGAWNTKRDPEALSRVRNAGVRIHFVWLANGDWLRYDEDLLEAVSALDGAAAELVARLHRDERIRDRIEAGHMKAWDETAVLSLLEPGRVGTEPLGGEVGHVRVHEVSPVFVREQVLARLGAEMGQTLPPRASVVLDSYPVDPSMMREDVARVVPTLIERHGMEEWKATWLTNELHRHLGIYSIIGAKMGVRARELLGASVDEVEVASEAGSSPPLACLNDGLQVSTGASLGRGTISVREDEARVAAEFSSGDRKVHLRLRDEVVQRIREDIRQAIADHGKLTPAYFARVRQLAIEYWAELDRSEIFVEHFH